MQYSTFGRLTGLRVSQMALGTGNFGTGWGHGAEPAVARRIFDRYAEAGGNFIDTADTYQAGQSESLVGECLAQDRDHFVLATKYTMGDAAGISRTGNSRKNMIRSVEASLRRLGTERIDLLWAHFTDGQTPMEEILRGFDDLARAGKIHYAGLSNFPAWRISRGDLLAHLRGWIPLAGVQFEYSLAERSAERELLPMAEALGLGAALWSPLGGGALTGKYRRQEEGRLQGLGMLVRTEKTERDTATLDAVLSVAEEVAVPPAQVAIAWVLERASRSSTSLIPILGPRTLEQLEGNLDALALQLSPDQVSRLETASATPLGTPHEQIAGNAAHIAGGDTERMKRPVVPVA